jgi:xanthine/CO dehydrogenase XdhC/CoxF family maturation factor
MNPGHDPTEAFHELSIKLRQSRKPYVVATVIEVFGSSSARTGSKAIFDADGKNLLGWVGGGCAEQHVAQQCIEALAENCTRIIEADLDDEIYGLGVACGGKMNLFLEPNFPAEAVELKTHYPREAIFLGKRYGWTVEAQTPTLENPAHSLSDLFLDLANAISQKRKRSGHSLREQRDLPVSFVPTIRQTTKRVTLVGSTRITEALTDHFQMLGYEVRNVGPLLTPYGKESDPEISFKTGEIVIVGSHTSQDPQIVQKVLKHDVAYVAMVGSRKRALELLKLLRVEESTSVTLPLFVPAGFDIDAKNPEEVALSIVAECLSFTIVR